jgi:hypothetical protein
MNQYEANPSPLTEAVTNATQEGNVNQGQALSTLSAPKSSSGIDLSGLGKIAGKIGTGVEKALPAAAAEEVAGAGPEDPIADVAAVGTIGASIANELMN